MHHSMEAAAKKCHSCSMLQGTVSCNGICWQGQCKPSVQAYYSSHGTRICLVPMLQELGDNYVPEQM